MLNNPQVVIVGKEMGSSANLPKITRVSSSKFSSDH